MSADENPAPVTLGIVGVGTMGAGIALVAMYAGYPVILQEMLDRARAYLEKFLKEYGEDRYRTCSLLRRWVRVEVISHRD